MIAVDFILSTTSSILGSLILDRYKKGNKPPLKTPIEDSIAERFIQIFEHHGIHRNQIPRVFDHGLSLHDVASTDNLLPKLSHCRTWSV